MQSPFVYPNDDLSPISYDLWEETDNFLNPCWKSPELSFSGGILAPDAALEDTLVGANITGSDAPFKTSLLDPEGLDAGRTIILIGIMGIVFFLVFIVNLLIWAKRAKKPNMESDDPVSTNLSFQRSHDCIVNIKRIARSNTAEYPPAYDAVIKDIMEADEELPTYSEAVKVDNDDQRIGRKN